MIKKRTAIIAGIIIFFLGVGVGSSGTETVEVERNLTTWQQLKEVDDQLINNCSEALVLGSQAIDAYTNLDLDRMDEINEELETLLPEQQTAASRRNEILVELGY